MLNDFQHKGDFDFLYSNNTIDTLLYTSPFKVLLDSHLLRYGDSDKIYCHVNHTEDTQYPYYIESYCPLTDAYITPIDTFYQMKVKVDAPKQNSIVKSAENEENVIVIGNQKYDLSLTEFIEIEMESDKLIVLDNIMITKNMFFVAANGFEYNNTSCKLGYFQNGFFICQNHLPCSNGGKTTDGRCAACQVINCVMCDGDKGKCMKCKENLTYNTNTNTCEEYTNCLSFTEDKCLRCNDGFVFEGNNCVDITKDNRNCQIKVGVPSECRLCDLTNTTLINSNGVCNGFYVQDNMCNNCTINNEGSLLCSFKNTEKCDKTYYVKEDGSVCVKNVCSEGINNEENGKCAPQIDNCIKYVNGRCVECSSKYSYDGNVSCVEPSTVDVNCGMATPVGCIRCDGNTFLNVMTHKCETCNSNCESCLDSTKCLSCVDGYFLSNHICKSNDALNDTCARKVPNGNGCLWLFMCKDGYYTVNGNECQKCVERCAKCSEQYRCTSCDDTFVLKSTSCVSYNTITKCTKTKDSKCSSCTFWYSPSDDGTFCSKTAVWWVILLIVVVIIAILVLVTVLVFFVMVKVIKNKRDTSGLTLFKLKHTNMTFVEMADGLTIHTRNEGFVITDDDLDEDKIDVNKEIKNLFSIGNTTNHKVKIQFTSKTNEKYYISFYPQIITIPPNYGCEFSLFLTPLCNSTMDSSFVINYFIFANDSETCTHQMDFKYITKISTRLDPDSLIEEKQISVGSFGVVFKGKLGRNTVAIKKMKNATDSKDQMAEFEKEVSMLDKFRCDYIICMVTEFAEFGSVCDMLKNKDAKDVDMKLRIKMCLDATKGVSYLHKNGILHRDIKPDNVLLFSLNPNDVVNGKLTDFGSSRNINMMMTNMTFTKGIGTPIYMAPEVLNKEKYKMPCDIYSLAISFFEIIGWAEPFPKKRFKHPWEIANFIGKGDHLTYNENFGIETQEMINSMWDIKPKKRILCDEIVKRLETIFSKFQ
ncbi:protein serine/threonine kinase, putative [Entamoeba invadens IP1]|uniref:Protein serine/threonine kinase, putative n=1 Tax=Entamoeba invadens IP1 TaxID=370355 RepID=A0A0A1TUA5_ENTIV|nr:protein serine/threonine kinase, putative [Entamoeba invadens IP1]ELP83573.1 protein serine/threonine kinase, putative [Entamoeba invadens IP1]|eukprot:XP_004182919.1 protein serine/threonine kinase, putative [Entamoeba invadens IP1]